MRKYAKNQPLTLLVLHKRCIKAVMPMPTINVDLSELPKLTNEKFYPLYQNNDRYLVLMGGG
jgi:hypothetical protein